VRRVVVLPTLGMPFIDVHTGQVANQRRKHLIFLLLSVQTLCIYESKLFASKPFLLVLTSIVPEAPHRAASLCTVYLQAP
jgi:hypothetical protein